MKLRKVLAIILLAAFLLTVAQAETPRQQYDQALILLQKKNYAQAADVFAAVGDYEDAASYVIYCHALNTARNGHYGAAAALMMSLPELADASQWAVYFTARQYEKEMRYEQAQPLYEGLADFSDAAQRAQTCAQAIPRRDYQAAAAALKAGHPEEALEIFRSLTNYSDSSRQAEALEIDMDRAENARETARRMIYDSAMDIQGKEASPEQLKEAMALFQALGDFLNSVEMVQQAQDRVFKADEAKRQSAYNDAVEAHTSGDLETAYHAFLGLGDYRDSAEQAAQIKREIDYANAQSLFEKEQYEAAREVFLALGDYKDAAELAKQAELNAEYAKASSLLVNGQYEKAHEAFLALGNYKDAAELAKQAELNAEYAKASSLLVNGQYEKARDAFLALGDFKDAAEMAKKADSMKKCEYRVENVKGFYGFEKNLLGYYESTNKKIPNSTARCKLSFRTTTGVVYLDCINYAEKNADYGGISKLDKELGLGLGYSAVFNSYSYNGRANSNGIQTITIKVPDRDEHYVYIQYKKNDSVDENYDSFQFKVRFE